MINKYLITSPLSWLLEETDPLIRYLTLRDINEEKNLQKEYNGILKTPEIDRLLKNASGGILGNSRAFGLFYRGTMWCFAEAVERGLDIRSDVIVKTADFLFKRCQTEAGAFIHSWNPESPTACRTGDMVKYLQLAGYDDERIERGISWITEHQRHDGGWLYCPISTSCDFLKLLLFNRAGKGIQRESDTSVTSCFYATIACLYALILYNKRNSDANQALRSGIEFFLRRRIFKNRNNHAINPSFWWNRDFRLLGYPVLNQFDILYCMIVIARGGYLQDTRTGEAFNLIVSKQNNDGTWNLENAQTGMMYGNMKNPPLGKRNKWVTLNAMRVFKHLHA